ncbi:MULTISPECIES: hypothetical protein [Actinokineospora]|uniref:Uncharacterized protein n=1 Tax=Actinokineospora fastidiosa TaxID=1816 RepID=A0A918GFN6_9PSEU|nr:MULTISPECIES: hypothetical protein [Actinokineospora]UVS79639.1 hypothetical protein Actkin_03389 [Actinokineospora sp. UTMC 2448]GGS30037.1 hypothetical protein GCM10010171_24340 [Actinokineospora fastidiosa]
MTEFDPARTPDEAQDSSALPPVEVSPEDPEADAVEQAQPAQDERPEEPPRELPSDANPADALDQHRTAAADEEDYR